MGTKSPSSLRSAEDEAVRLTGTELSLDSLIRKVHSPKYGAIVTFLGCVRNDEEGSLIQSITYEAYSEMAVKEIQKIVSQTESRWTVKAAIDHKTGRVRVGEASVMIACAGAHRKEAFQACEFMIDELKSKVPIWKVKFE